MTEHINLKDMDSTITYLRNKYLENGFKSLTEKEKLMMLLSYAVSGNNIEASADKILNAYGTINNATEVDAMFLAKQCDISNRAALLITLISHIVRRDDIMIVNDKVLDSVSKVKAYFSAYLKNSVKELVVLTAVNNKFNVIKTHFIGKGEFDKAYIQVMDIIEFAIKNNSKYIFISHSHPTASSKPSDSDISTTQSIIRQLKNAEIKLIDHIIVSRKKSTSMREVKPEIFEPIEKYKMTKNKSNKSNSQKNDKEKK